ncbi:hypothetical protein FRB99_007792 [Tulasnella sp. 403]|nr:hypothetical protein FRB99_007792 [Tulasnella sp. 403]
MDTGICFPTAALNGSDIPNSTISTLPTELVVQIVFRSLEDEVDYPTIIHQRAQVCRRWRDIILSEPTFWSIVSPLYRDEWVKWALRKSGDVPLSIFWLPSYRGSYPEPGYMPRFFKRHIHRCCTLVLDCNSSATESYLTSAHFRRVLYDPRPRLRAFLITNDGPLIFPANYVTIPPTFRKIHISSAVLFVFWPIMTDLTSLRIQMPSKPVDFEHLTRALSSSPRLQFLSLEWLVIRRRLNEPTPSSINLPALEVLRLVYLQKDDMAALMRTISAPASSEVVIQCANTDFNPPELFAPSLGGVSAMTWLARNEAEYLSIRCSKEPLPIHVVNYKTSELSVKLCFLGGDFTNPLTTMLDGPQGGLPSITSLDIEPSLLSTEVLQYLASKTPSVEKLTAQLQGMQVEDPIAFLVDASGKCLWPNLHSLSIRARGDWWFSPVSVIRFLRTHTQRGNSLAHTSHSAPPKFRYLSICGATRVFDDEAVKDEIGALVDIVEFVHVGVIDLGSQEVLGQYNM